MAFSTTKNKGSLWMVFIVLLLPGVLGLVAINEKPLEGAYTKHEDARFTIRSWFTGEFQEQKSKFLAQNFGLSKMLVRLSNEIDYRLFKVANAKYVVIGKENYLYETDYIRSHYGQDFIGEKTIGAICSKLKCVQDCLVSQKKLLLTVIAPGKGDFFPEYIPGSHQAKKALTNYEVLSSQLKEKKLEHIDFNRYFLQEKSSSPYPLYPRYGIHWSNYASILSFDSILKYTQNKLDVELGTIEIDSIHVTDQLQAPDDDVKKGLNLFTDLPNDKMAYPFVHVDKPVSTRKLNLLVVSDSFWWYLYGTGLPDKFFDSRFWFYNEEMYPETFTSPHFVNETNYFESIRKADVILILHSQATLYKIGNGFVEMCYETFCKPDKRKEEIQQRKGIIRATPEWYSQIQAKAANNSVSVDSMLSIDARYSLDKK